MRKYALLISTIILTIGFSSCYSCVECSGCTNPEDDVDTALCYKDAKDYYGSRKEWRDDVKEYEQRFGCECQ